MNWRVTVKHLKNCLDFAWIRDRVPFLNINKFRSFCSTSYSILAEEKCSFVSFKTLSHLVPRKYYIVEFFWQCLKYFWLRVIQPRSDSIIKRVDRKNCPFLISLLRGSFVNIMRKKIANKNLIKIFFVPTILLLMAFEYTFGFVFKTRSFDLWRIKLDL